MKALRSWSVSLTGPHPGENEPTNQDACARDDDAGIYAVADGLGAHHGSEVASRRVVERSIELVRGHRDDPDLSAEARLRGSLQQVCIELHRAGVADPELRAMSTTLSLLELDGGQYRGVHVGDSRIYLWRDRCLEQLTDDHSLAFEQYRAGAISKEELATHPNQQFLTRAISASKSFAIADAISGVCRPGDVYLLCTDGVNKLFSDAALADLLADHFGGTSDDSTPGDPVRVIDELTARARSIGLEDDFTAVVVAVD